MDINSSALRILGYDKKEIVGKPLIATVYASSYQEKAKRLFDQWKRTGKIRNEELDIITRGGETRTVLLSADSVEGAKGRLCHSVSIQRDITERKESEKRLRNTLDTMLEGCQIIDHDWRYIYVNDAAAEHGRTKKESLLGKTMMEAYPGIEETKLFSVLRRCMKERTAENIENLFSYPNGEQGWFELRIQPIPDGIFILSIDITQRKLNEKMRRELDERFRLLVEGTADYAIFMLNPEGYVVNWNNGAEKINGYTAEEIIGKHFSVFYCDDDVQRGKPQLSLKIAQEKGKFAEEGWRVRKDGSRFYASIVTTALHDEEGNVYGFSKITRDITERKKAEEKLKEEAVLRATLLDNLPCIAMVIKKGTCEIVASNKLAKDVGAVPGEICYRTCVQRADPCPFCLAPKLWATNETQTLEIEYSGKYYRCIWVHYNKELYVHYLFDITERKEAEEKLKQSEAWHRAVFENTGTAMCIVNEDGTYSMVNREFEELVGYSQEELKKKKWSDFVSKDDLERLKELRKAVWKKGEPMPKNFEFDLVTRNGEIRNVFITSTKFPETRKSIGSVIDITELKKVEKALNGSVGALSLVNEKLSVVGTLTRHDVRNKLSVVAGNMFIAKELLPPDHEAVNYLEKAEPAFEQIMQIFDRARAYERLGVDELSYIDVKKSCEEAISLVHDLGNIEIVMACEGLTVYADSLLGQLFYNLIDNTIKHGGTVSKIGMYYKESKNGVKLIYEDDGVGIAKSDKKKIFGEYHRKGAGIGLHMIKIMCNIYGWSIQETGKKGKGAQFKITIPKITNDGKPAYILAAEKN